MHSGLAQASPFVCVRDSVSLVIDFLSLLVRRDREPAWSFVCYRIVHSDRELSWSFVCYCIVHSDRELSWSFVCLCGWLRPRRFVVTGTL